MSINIFYCFNIAFYVKHCVEMFKTIGVGVPMRDIGKIGFSRISRGFSQTFSTLKIKKRTPIYYR